MHDIVIEALERGLRSNNMARRLIKHKLATLGGMVFLILIFVSRTAPHLTVLSGLAIMITVLVFNFLGDGLRDVLDPHA